MTEEINLMEQQEEGGYHETPIPEVIKQISLEQENEGSFYIKRVIEAILFASSTPVPFKKIRDIVHTVHQLKNKEIRQLIDELAEEYVLHKHAFRLEEIAEGYVLRSSPEYSEYLDILLNNKKVERLSPSATEVLAIIAYRQPITRPQVEAIRGVDCSGVIATLVERQLIESVGKADAPGRPMLYGTTNDFLEHYGLRDIKELPQFAHKGSEDESTPERETISRI